MAPGRPAAKDRSCDLTYGELAAGIAATAGAMVRRGVGAGDRVALHLPNSVDFLVASCAAMWTGAVFVPLALPDPAARLRTILASCRPSLVVTTEPDRPDGAYEGYRTCTPSLLREEAAGGEPAPAPYPAGADEGAYCIYTSGTTGEPKGVLIGHGAFDHSVSETSRRLGLGPETRALCVSPFHFDGSFGTLFPVPASGGSLVILPREALVLPRMFFSAVAEEAINHTSCSPSYLRRLLASPKLPSLAGTALATLGLGGEECVADDLARLWEAVPGLRVFNRYGPTETTIAVTTSELRPSDAAPGRRLPIGRPHDGVSFHLLDENGAPIDRPGVTGELFIGGAQLMNGYLGDPATTAAVLRDDVVPGRLVYRTGDLVTCDEDGRHVFVDRADRVVKRDGVRLSLAEVARALRAVEGVEAATCAAYAGEGGLAVAGFVVDPTGRPEAELRQGLRELLPITMLPNVLVSVDALPVTSSAKVDEAQLLEAAGLEPLRRHAHP